MPLAMRLPKLRGNTSKDAMPVGPFRTYTQPVNIRDLDALRGRRGGHARDAEGEGSDPLGPQGREAARRRRADEEALDHGARRLGDRAREGRGRRRHTDAPQGAEGAEGQEAQACAARSDDGEPEARRAAEPRTEARRRRRRPTSRGRGVGPALLARQRVARPGAPAAGCCSRRSSSRCTASARGCPRPASTRATIEDYFSGQGGTVLGLLNLFSGSALSRFSLFALGIMPYVTASIILQLLTVVMPEARGSSRRKARPATPRSTSTRATSPSSSRPRRASAMRTSSSARAR